MPACVCAMIWGINLDRAITAAHIRYKLPCMGIASKTHSCSDIVTNTLQMKCIFVSDTGFSTHCEAKGADINVGKLWSARLICDAPEIIKAVHTGPEVNKQYPAGGHTYICMHIPAYTCMQL